MNRYLLIALIFVIIVGSVVGLILGLHRKNNDQMDFEEYLTTLFDQYLDIDNEIFKSQNKRKEFEKYLKTDNLEMVTLFTSLVFEYFKFNDNRENYLLVMQHIMSSDMDNINTYKLIFDTIYNYVNNKQLEKPEIVELLVDDNNNPYYSTIDGLVEIKFKNNTYYRIFAHPFDGMQEQEIIDLNFNLFT